MYIINSSPSWYLPLNPEAEELLLCSSHTTLEAGVAGDLLWPPGKIVGSLRATSGYVGSVLGFGIGI